MQHRHPLTCQEKSDFIHAVETKHNVPQVLFFLFGFFLCPRFQLSLRVAAMCSKALYRVKTMDSLDYRDLVCVFFSTVSPITIGRSSSSYPFFFKIKQWYL